MRIYPAEHSVPKILAASRKEDVYGDPFISQATNELDVVKLSAALAQIDIPSTQKRRSIYNRLAQEAHHQSGSWPGGLSFTDTLLMIAHNKLIVEDEALT